MFKIIHALIKREIADLKYQDYLVNFHTHHGNIDPDQAVKEHQAIQHKINTLGNISEKIKTIEESK